MISSNILLGPPGVGKTTLQQKFPERIIDPEESIDWLGIDAKHNPYPHRVHDGIRIRFEHELDWPTVWIKHVLPRIWAAVLLRKDIVMGLITPGNTEIVCRFLETFRGHTTVLLPNELRHFQQTWNDEKKRPKTWGSMLCGWQNTFWIRILLRGIAQELGLKVVEKAIVKKRPPRRKPSTAAREARASNGREYLEIFFGHWAELDKVEQIVAMHVGTETANGVDLMCDKTSKACANNTHDCDVVQNLTNDVKGRPLTSWIATDKLKAIHGTKNAVIFFTGTLAPFHHGHLAILNSAKAELQKKGWNVLGGYVTTFTTLRDNRLGELVDVLNPVQHRHTMAQLGVATSDWLMVDHPIDHVLDSVPLKHDQHPVQRIVKRLRECGALSKKTPVTTFWINGKDARVEPDFFTKFTKYADSNPLNPLRILVVDNRPGEDLWSKRALMATVPMLIPFVSHKRVREPRPTSATAVRHALTTSNRATLRTTVGLPLVEAYLLGLMHIHENL